MIAPPQGPPPLPPDDLLVTAYADGELAPADQQAFETRLAAEPALRAAVSRLGALRTAVQARVPQSVASEAFRERIMRIGAQPPPLSRTAGRWLTGHRPADWRRLAATVILAGGIASMATFWATYWATSRPAPWVASAALVAIHQHALLAAEPVEVASSDRHTVKPWFDAKLALSPLVVDLAADGFTLLGGRIDVVAGQRVPVTLYRRRAHLISVIAVPSPGSRDTGQRPVETTRDGYTVLSWHGPDFDFMAISDIAESELVEFTGSMRRAMRAP